MPITFILSGCILILLFFGFIKFKRLEINLSLIFLSALIFIGYISSNDLVFSVSINKFHLVAVLFLVLYFIFNSKLFKISLISVFSAGIYWFILNSDSRFLVSYNSNFYIFFSLLFSIIFINDFSKGVGVIFFNSLTLILIDLKFELDEFSFATLNFNYLFMNLILFLLIAFIYKVCSDYIMKCSRRRYEIKNCSIGFCA